MNKIKKSTYAVVFILIFFFALILNYWTPYIADDYAYMFSWMDAERITSFNQLIPSIYAHAFSMNGRLVPHFIVQFFMLFPKMVFNVVNAGMFAFLIYRLGKNAGIDGTDKFDVILTLIILGIYWCEIPAFGQVNLWLDGSCNYLWSYALAVWFLAPYFELLQNGEWKPKRVIMIAYAVLGLLFGNFSENVGLGAIGGAIIILILVKFVYKNLIPKCLFINTVLAFLSYIVIYVCPAQLANKSGSTDLNQLLKNAYDYSLYMYENCKELLILWAILFLLGVNNKVSREKLVLSIVCILMAIAANLIYIFASYYPERGFAGVVVFIIQANVLLLSEFKNRREIRIAILCFVLFFFNIRGAFVDGVKDIHSLHEQQQRREILIERQIESGEENVVIPEFTYTTKYSARNGLRDVRKESTDWPNVSMAKYYNVKSIIKE